MGWFSLPLNQQIHAVEHTPSTSDTTEKCLVGHADEPHTYLETNTRSTDTDFPIPNIDSDINMTENMAEPSVSSKHTSLLHWFSWPHQHQEQSKHHKLQTALHHL
ncbi:hypothetical protein PoB_006550400 [Plakobranchus ocellatus]|uniref:Uncharacterized protein n=1 Tax=Plakobranchus ocellatus TaxID=259542 RepID=A0AAV4D4E3_9GAST|nr:hypothetical protein PoB_006550400 [Plakobranchus ocellatus]